MAETTVQAFSTGVASLLSYVFSSISQGLAAKGITVSVDELSAMTNTPVKPAMQTTGLTPPGLFGTAGVPVGLAAKTTKTGTRTPKAKCQNTDTFVQGKTCGHYFDRKNANNYGKYCGNPTSDGNTYCDPCMTSYKGVQKLVQANGLKHVPQKAGAVAAPAIPVVPGTPGVAPAVTAVEEPGKLNVEWYDESRKLYRDINHNFIVTEESPGKVFCIGYLADNGKIVALTPEQTRTAIAMGLLMMPEKAPVAAPVVTPVPTIPTLGAGVAAPAPMPMIPGAVPVVGVPVGIPSAH